MVVRVPFFFIFFKFVREGSVESADQADYAPI